MTKKILTTLKFKLFQHNLQVLQHYFTLYDINSKYKNQLKVLFIKFIKILFVKFIEILFHE